MIVAIMQPYFFPYIGYFQLMRACDVFVVLDDVQYMKGGWINRNRILLGGQPHWLTCPVVKDSVTLNINQRLYKREEGARSVVAAVENAYRKAPHAAQTLADVRTIMEFPDPNVAAFNTHLLRHLHARLGLTSKLLISSQLDKTPALTGEARVIDICRRLGATKYVNAIGGLDLYDRRRFAVAGMELSFLKAKSVPYPQFGGEFVPFLSILDVLMFNAPDDVGRLLEGFDLI